MRRIRNTSRSSPDGTDSRYRRDRPHFVIHSDPPPQTSPASSRKENQKNATRPRARRSAESSSMSASISPWNNSRYSAGYNRNSSAQPRLIRPPPRELIASCAPPLL